MTAPYIRTANFVYNPTQVIPPFPCEIATEGTIVPAGMVPSYLPGKNELLSEFLAKYGILPEAALGGVETMYPEYIAKMRNMKTLPSPKKGTTQSEVH